MSPKLSLLLFLIACQYMTAAIPKSEKQALIDLYNSTNGENWTDQWNLNKPIITWHGVEVENGNVVAIRLMDNNLSGVLPESLGDLTKLRVFDVAFNKIKGQIPRSVTQLNRLEELRFGKNKLSGDIPEGIVNLGQLKVLDLFHNELSGKLPANVEKLQKLEVLSISDNSFSGRLPQGLGELKNLKRLELGNNQIEGDIPESISRLKNLKTIVFAENKFEGKFPSSILTLPNLKIVQLQRNNFDQFHLKNSLPAESGFALLDYDNEDKFSKGSFKAIYLNNDIRTADTKFDDEEENQRPNYEY